MITSNHALSAEPVDEPGNLPKEIDTPYFEVSWLKDSPNFPLDLRVSVEVEGDV